MFFRYIGLAPEPFASLWSLDDAGLAQRGMHRVVADRERGFPCRISLRDASAGETLLLLPYQHHDVAGPYRASGPIFIRRDVMQAIYDGEVPPFFRYRLLSLRGYDAAGNTRKAGVVEGTVLETAVTDCFADDQIAYAHVHNARPGCYACRIERG